MASNQCVLSKDGEKARDELLKFLYPRKKTNQSELAKITELDRATIARLIDRNEKKSVQKKSISTFFEKIIEIIKIIEKASKVEKHLSGNLSKEVKKYLKDNLPKEIEQYLKEVEKYLKDDFSKSQEKLYYEIDIGSRSSSPSVSSELLEQESNTSTSQVLDNYNQRPHEIRNNLAAGQYAKFIGRNQQIKELKKYLIESEHSCLIAVEGPGGVGKSSLVLEVAHQLKKIQENVGSRPNFNAIVFTSIQKESSYDEESFRDRRDICLAIADVLNEPSINSNEQVREVKRILIHRKILLIVDSLESLKEPLLILEFLKELPNAKVVITTRKLLREADSTLDYKSIRLDNLSKNEGLEFIDQLISDRNISLSEEEKNDLYKHCAGIPPVIVCACNQLNSHSLQDVKEMLPLDTNVKRRTYDWFLREIQGRPAYKLFMAMTFFPQFAQKDAIAQVAGLTNSSNDIRIGFANLLDLIGKVWIKKKEKEEYYELRSLCREYATEELNINPEFKTAALERWINWYLEFAKKYGGDVLGEWWFKGYKYIYDEWKNLQAVLSYCKTNKLYEQGKCLWKYLDSYTDIYRLWNDRTTWLDWLIQESLIRQDWSTFVYAKSRRASIFILERNQEKARTCLLQEKARTCLLEASEHYTEIDTNTQIDLDYYKALYEKDINEYETAYRLMEELSSKINNSDLENEKQNRYLANALYFQGNVLCRQVQNISDSNRLEVQKMLKEAKGKFEEGINIADRIEWLRYRIRAETWLGYIAIQEGEFSEADRILNNGLKMAKENRDLRCVAFFYETLAILENGRRDFSKCIKYATKAGKYFNKLQMIRQAERIKSLIKTVQSSEANARSK